MVLFKKNNFKNYIKKEGNLSMSVINGEFVVGHDSYWDIFAPKVWFHY